MKNIFDKFRLDDHMMTLYDCISFSEVQIKVWFKISQDLLNVN